MPEDADSFPSLLIDRPERTPGQIEQMVLSVTPKSPLEVLAAALDAADWLTARSRAIHLAAKNAGIAWIEKNGEFNIGPFHYSVGYSKTVKCTNVPGCGHAILEAVQGDFDQFLTFLCSDAIRYGAARSVLNPRAFAQFFETKVVTSLKDGSPLKILQRADPTFCPRKSRK